MDELREGYRKVLDHGFVRLVDSMGDDSAIVAAARVSYGAGTKRKREDAALIGYLMRHRHTTPFEAVTLKFHIKAPIFVARQIMRHRTASISEISGRYSELSDEYYLPEEDALRRQSMTNKQGRDKEIVAAPDSIRHAMKQQQNVAHTLYGGWLYSGLAREVARINLPLSLYTEWYWKIDLHNLFHFLGLRLGAHTQEETRAYAEALARCARAVAPLAYEAFEEYIRYATTFSRSEMAVLRQMLRQETVSLDSPDHTKTWKREFEEKLGFPLENSGE